MGGNSTDTRPQRRVNWLPMPEGMDNQHGQPAHRHAAGRVGHGDRSRHQAGQQDGCRTRGLASARHGRTAPGLCGSGTECTAPRTPLTKATWAVRKALRAAAAALYALRPREKRQPRIIKGRGLHCRPPQRPSSQILQPRSLTAHAIAMTSALLARQTAPVASFKAASQKPRAGRCALAVAAQKKSKNVQVRRLAVSARQRTRRRCCHVQRRARGLAREPGRLDVVDCEWRGRCAAIRGKDTAVWVSKARSKAQA